MCIRDRHQLVTDGRIHPARIEEVVTKVEKQIEEEIIEVGKRTTIDLGIHGLHPDMIRLIGKMKYRSSYGQNLLQHSRETANLCGIMAVSYTHLPPVESKAVIASLKEKVGKLWADNRMLRAELKKLVAERDRTALDVYKRQGKHRAGHRGTRPYPGRHHQTYARGAVRYEAGPR